MRSCRRDGSKLSVCARTDRRLDASGIYRVPVKIVNRAYSLQRASCDPIWHESVRIIEVLRYRHCMGATETLARLLLGPTKMARVRRLPVTVPLGPNAA